MLLSRLQLEPARHRSFSLANLIMDSESLDYWHSHSARRRRYCGSLSCRASNRSSLILVSSLRVFTQKSILRRTNYEPLDQVAGTLRKKTRGTFRFTKKDTHPVHLPCIFRNETDRNIQMHFASSSWTRESWRDLPVPDDCTCTT